MSAKLIIVGGGEHARVVAQIAYSRRDEWELEGFVAPQPEPQIQDKMHLPWLGADADLEAMLEEDHRRFLVLGVGAVGAPERRRQIVKQVSVAGSKWASVIDASARLSPSACIGNGVVVMPGALINCGAILGDHCVINTGSIIEHDVSVGAFAQVAPGAVVGGGAVLEADVHIGLGARVRDHVTVGASAIVGMGAAVISNVPARATVFGVPARLRNK
jgi:acetyltransferase EpsM